jgi:hypothetical protein
VAAVVTGAGYAGGRSGVFAFAPYPALQSGLRLVTLPRLEPAPPQAPPRLRSRHVSGPHHVPGARLWVHRSPAITPCVSRAPLNRASRPRRFGQHSTPPAITPTRAHPPAPPASTAPGAQGLPRPQRRQPGHRQPGHRYHQHEPGRLHGHGHRTATSTATAAGNCEQKPGGCLRKAIPRHSRLSHSHLSPLSESSEQIPNRRQSRHRNHCRVTRVGLITITTRRSASPTGRSYSRP